MASDLVRRAQPWLGTVVEIALTDGRADQFATGFDIISRIHRLMSFHEPTSDLSRLHAAPPNTPVTVSAHTVSVLREALELFEVSEGAFDVTIASELTQWGFLPWPIQTPALCPGANSRHIRIIDDHTVEKLSPLVIDLGGIAKGYAIDCAVEALKATGASGGLINAGGDLRVFGEVSAPVAIRAADWSGVDAVFDLEDGAAATSANATDRKSHQNKARSPHVDARTREAILTPDSVTVCAPFAIHADALTKVALADPALANRIAPRYQAEILFSKASTT